MNRNYTLADVLANPIVKSSTKPIVKVEDIRGLDTLLPSSVINLHNDKMTIKKFNSWFKELCVKIKETEYVDIPETLTFYDKYKIGKIYQPDLKVWAIACVFEPTLKDGEIGVWWNYIISTSGDLAKAHSKTQRGPRLKDGVYVNALHHNVFPTSRIILSTFGKDIETNFDKNQLKVGYFNNQPRCHELLNLYWE